MTIEDEDVSAADTMTLTEHLAELRVRIIRSALAVAIGMVLIIAFYDQVLDFLLQPYVDLCARKSEDFCAIRSSSTSVRPKGWPLGSASACTAAS